MLWHFSNSILLIQIYCGCYIRCPYCYSFRNWWQCQKTMFELFYLYILVELMPLSHRTTLTSKTPKYTGHVQYNEIWNNMSHKFQSSCHVLSVSFTSMPSCHISYALYCLVIRVGYCDIDGVGLDVPRDFGCCGVTWMLLFSVCECSDPWEHQWSSLDR